MSVTQVARWCLVIVVSFIFFVTGVTKFTSPAWVTRFDAWGYPSWVRLAVGALEILCAILLWVPRSRRWAVLVLLVIMTGAAITHGIHGEAPRMVVNALLACLLIGIQTFPLARTYHPRKG
jgi:putative oxidoreductase